MTIDALASFNPQATYDSGAADYEKASSKYWSSFGEHTVARLRCHRARPSLMWLVVRAHPLCPPRKSSVPAVALSRLIMRNRCSP